MAIACILCDTWACVKFACYWHAKHSQSQGLILHGAYNVSIPTIGHEAEFSGIFQRDQPARCLNLEAVIQHHLENSHSSIGCSMMQSHSMRLVLLEWICSLLNQVLGTKCMPAQGTTELLRGFAA